MFCVTKKSVEPMSLIHNRQPLLLDDSQVDNWLKGDYILKDIVSSSIITHRVSQYVNSPKNNDFKCIQPIK